MRRSFIFMLGSVLASAWLPGCSRSPQQREAAFLAAGRKHFQVKDFERARLDFRNAAQAMPKDAEPHYQLGLTYLESGDAQSAAQQFMESVKLNPAHYAAQLKLADMMSTNTSLDVVKQGREKAQAVLAASPDNADALQTLAVAELRLEDSGDAVQHLEHALAAAPEHLKAAMTLAMVKLHANDADGAEQVLLKSAAGAPRSPEHALVLGRFYQLVRKPVEAEGQFRHALELDPKNGPALAALGSLLYGEGRQAEAEPIFRRASALPDKQYRPLHASFLLLTGKGEDAIRELDEQYKGDRQDRSARTRLIAAYFKLGRKADAEKVLTDALRRNPKDTDALLQRSELSLAVGKLQEAQSDLTEVIRNRPDSPEAHFLLARVHGARRNSQMQIQELSEALRLDPKMLETRLELAHAFTLSNSPKSALDVLDQAPPQDRQAVALIVERNTALSQLQDYAQLRKTLDRELAVVRDPRLLMQDASLKSRQKDYRGSRASLEEVLKQQPQAWPAVEALAMNYLAENKKAEASAIVQQYTSAAPNAAGGRLLLGSWLLRTGDITGARLAFQEAKRIEPQSETADFSLAKIAVQERKLDAARDLLNGIVGREPRNVLALSFLGEIESKAGHPEAAIRYYDRAIQEDPNNVPCLNNLAYLLADTKTDPDRALALCQRAKELAPGDATIDDSIGWAYYNKGLFRPARDYLVKAGKGGTPLRKCHLAMADIELGDWQEAETLIQAALKEDPSSPDAQRAIRLLAQAR